MTAASPNDDLVTVALPADVAAELAARVDSGEFGSEGDVVRQGLRLITEEDAALHDPDVEQWLREVVVPIAEATMADPSRSIPASQVEAELAAERARWA
ncbi:MAG: type II toxin-antitoxin system ParD family antitoxin [Nocardioidaceae bacterium]